MQQSLKIVLITVIAFGLYYSLQQLYFVEIRTWLESFVGNIGVSHFLTYLIVGVPLFVAVGWIRGGENYFDSLGFGQPFGRGLLLGLLCTSPMFIGYAIVFDFNVEITWTQIFTGAVIAALAEELFFRGILFGQVYRFTALGFVPSILLGALVFALGHLYQSQEFSTLLGVFFTTFLGAIWFAWLYVEWDYNLWVPIFLHLLMNLAWMMFSVADNAFGGSYANIFRIATIALTVGLTIWFKRKNGLGLAVNRHTFWMQKNGPPEKQ
jgi:membrane protease YdiL (CAAX protease family)